MLRSQRGVVLHGLMVLVTLAILVVMIYKPGPSRCSQHRPDSWNFPLLLHILGRVDPGRRG